MRKLNPEQLDILHSLYLFRFATSTLLFDKLKPAHRESINSRLNILHKHKLIGRHYDKSYKLDRKPATYFLLPDAFQFLKQEYDVSDKMLRRIYNDRKATDSFIEYCLQIFAVSNTFDRVYGERIEFFTESEMIDGFDHFPKPLPRAFINFKPKPRSQPRSYFVELPQHSKPFFTVSKKLDQYLAYAKSTKWDREVADFPKVLFICDHQTLEKRIHRQANRLYDDQPSYLHFYTTTTDKFLDMDEYTDDVWLRLSENGHRRLTLFDV